MLSFCTCCCLDCLLLNGLPQHSRTFLQICVLYIIVYKYMYIIHNMSLPQIGIHIHWKSLTYIIIFMIIYIIYIYIIYTCFRAECWSQLTLDLVGHRLCVVWSPPFWYVETHHFNIYIHNYVCSIIMHWHHRLPKSSMAKPCTNILR